MIATAWGAEIWYLVLLEMLTVKRIILTWVEYLLKRPNGSSSSDGDSAMTATSYVCGRVPRLISRSKDFLTRQPRFYVHPGEEAGVHI